MDPAGRIAPEERGGPCGSARVRLQPRGTSACRGTVSSKDTFLEGDSLEDNLPEDDLPEGDSLEGDLLEGKLIEGKLLENDLLDGALPKGALPKGALLEDSFEQRVVVRFPGRSRRHRRAPPRGLEASEVFAARSGGAGELHREAWKFRGLHREVWRHRRTPPRGLEVSRAFHRLSSFRGNREMSVVAGKLQYRFEIAPCRLGRRFPRDIVTERRSPQKENPS